MLRKILIAACLISGSGSALALDQFISRHGIRVEPHVSITLGSGHHSNVYRETRHHDVYYRERHHDVYVPRPVYVQPVYHNNYYYRGHGGRHYGGRQQWQDPHHRGWRGHDRHDDDDDDDDD